MALKTLDMQDEGWFKRYRQEFPDAPPDVFHIGYHKTGSTFLQRDVLESLNKVRFFSSEAISGPYLSDRQDAAQWLHNQNPNAKIIVSLRAQPNIFKSLYYLYVKTGGVLPLHKFVEQAIDGRKCDYLSLFESLHSCFDKDRIKIMLFEDLITNEQDFVDAFVSFVKGEPVNGFPYNADNQNRSPSRTGINYIRFMNKIPIPGKTKFANNTYGGIERILNRSKRPKIELSDETRALIEKTYSISNTKLSVLLDRDLKGLGYPCA